jgi:hypothetical protein
VQLGRTGDRHDPRLLLRQEPAERDLRRSRLLPFGDLPQQFDQRLIRLAVLRREAREGAAPEIAAGERRAFVDLALEESLPSGLKGTKPIPSSSQAGSTSFSGSVLSTVPGAWAREPDESVKRSGHLTTQSTIRDVLSHPAFAGFSRLILPWDGRPPMTRTCR